MRYYTLKHECPSCGRVYVTKGYQADTPGAVWVHEDIWCCGGIAPMSILDSWDEPEAE